MIRSKTIALLFSFFVFASVSFAQDWMHIGEYQIEGEDFSSSQWLDVDSIVPAAKMTSEGRVEILPFTYQFIVDEDDARTTGSNLVDLRAEKSLALASNELEWSFNAYGADRFFFNAYLIKNFEKIHQRQPFILQDELVLQDRRTEWPVDENGWKQVYQRDMTGRAWVQTKSAQLSSMEGDLLPGVRVLVRYHTGGAWPVVYYSYVEYNPEGRFRDLLGSWDENWNPITGDESESDFYYLNQEKEMVIHIATPEAAIATEAYMPFILDPALIENRPSFVEKEHTDEIPADWKVFVEKE